MNHSSHVRPSLSPTPAPTPFSRRWCETTWWILVAYCLFVLGLIGVSLVSGDRYWLVEAFGYVRDVALLIALVPLPIALWRRRRHPVLLQLICAISLLWAPASASDLARTAPAGSTEVSVMTYNLGNGLAKPDEVVPYLINADADIVGLQEVSPEMATALEQDLQTEYPYRVVYGLGIPGKALLSKFPIVDHQLLDNNQNRPDLLATVDVDGMQTTVFVAHPPPPHLTPSGVVARPGGDEQFAALIETISRTSGPVLLLGDLNITKHHDRYDQLEATGLVDAFAESGSGFGYTHPARMSALNDVSQTLGDAPAVPLLRIDYIWGSSHWYPVETWVAEDGGSDHLPLKARMALINTPAHLDPQAEAWEVRIRP